MCFNCLSVLHLKLINEWLIGPDAYSFVLSSEGIETHTTCSNFVHAVFYAELISCMSYTFEFCSVPYTQIRSVLHLKLFNERLTKPDVSSVITLKELNLTLHEL